MKALSEACLPFYDRSQTIIAHLKIVPCREYIGHGLAPMIQRAEMDALEHGETAIQLCESERYEYEVLSDATVDYRLRCSLANRRRSLGAHQPDAGLIETRSFCGTLTLELLAGEADDKSRPIATAFIDVRATKLSYRTEYRGMLRRISREMVGLVVDARSSTKLTLHSKWQSKQFWRH